MVKHNKLSISQVKAAFKRGTPFNGFLVGNLVNQFHWFNGWHLAHAFKCDTYDEFVKHKNACEFYLERELGTRMAIYSY